MRVRRMWKGHIFFKNIYFFQDVIYFLDIKHTLLLLSLSKNRWTELPYWEVIWKKMGIQPSLPKLTTLLKLNGSIKALHCKYCSILIDIMHTNSEENTWNQVKRWRAAHKTIKKFFYCNDCFQTICKKCSDTKLANCKHCNIQLSFCICCLNRAPGTNRCWRCASIRRNKHTLRKN